MQTDCFPDLAANWRKAPVSALAEVNPRYPIKKEREYPFVEMASVGENFTGIKDIGWRSLEGSGLTRFRVRDTLFAKITPCPQNGKIAFVEELSDEIGLGSTEFIVLSPLQGTDPRFLYHISCSHEFRGRAVARMEGSTGRQRVPEEVFTRRLLVPIPSPEEQKAIARALDTVDKALKETRLAQEAARSAKYALLQELLRKGTRGQAQRKTPIGLVPKSWMVAPLASAVLSFQYGLSVPMQTKGELPILRMGDIQEGGIRLEDLKYVSLNSKVTAPYLLKRGDVLFNRTNSQELVGKAGIYRHDTPAVFASYLIRVIPDRAKIDSYFLGHVLNSYSAQCRIKRYATPGVQQVNINATNLGKVLIPIPPETGGLDEQQEIAQVLEAADALVRRFEPKITALQTLKKTLAHDLFTGRVSMPKTAEAEAA